jgi:hypothetical protein
MMFLNWECPAMRLVSLTGASRPALKIKGWEARYRAFSSEVETGSREENAAK